MCQICEFSAMQANLFEGDAATSRSFVNVASPGIDYIDGILTQTKWTDSTLSFSFPEAQNELGFNFREFTGGVNERQVELFKYYANEVESFTNLDFVEYTSEGPAGQQVVDSNIKVLSADVATATASVPYGGSSGIAAPASGTISMGPRLTDGDLGGLTAMLTGHELGHVLGLKHGQISYPSNTSVLPYEYDHSGYSIMTYTAAPGTDSTFRSIAEGSLPVGYMGADIAALQYLYGANYNHNAGNTTYKVDAVTGDFFINGVRQVGSSEAVVYRTIWDGNGEADHYDFSNFDSDISIDLRPGRFVDLDVGGNNLRADLSTGFREGPGYARDGSSIYYDSSYVNPDPNRFADGHLYNAFLHQGNTSSLIENATAGSGNDVLIGNLANNRLDGGSGNDVLRGGDGNDRLLAGEGVDTYDGGNGIDQYDIQYTSQIGIAQNINLETGRDSFGNTFTNIENVRSGNANDVLIGDAANNVLEGYNGDDLMNGGDGNDVLNGGLGNDRLLASNGVDYYIGNLGIDQYDIQGTVKMNVAQNINLETRRDSFGNYFEGIENVRSGNANDVLIGDAANNVLEGYGGNDVMNGGDGNDVLNGGLGNDRLLASNGVDYYIGNLGIDQYDIQGTVKMNVAQNINLETRRDSFGNYFEGVENVRSGNANDVLIGDAANNVLEGYDGDDFMNGGDGNDVLNGGLGNDDLIGARGGDILIGNLGDDTIKLTTRDTGYGDSGNDTFLFDPLMLEGAGSIGVRGGSGFDTLDLSGVSDVTLLSVNESNGSYAGAFTYADAAGDIIRVNYSEIENFVGTDVFDVA